MHPHSGSGRCSALSPLRKRGFRRFGKCCGRCDPAIGWCPDIRPEGSLQTGRKALLQNRWGSRREQIPVAASMRRSRRNPPHSVRFCGRRIRPRIPAPTGRAPGQWAAEKSDPPAARQGCWGESPALSEPFPLRRPGEPLPVL